MKYQITEKHSDWQFHEFEADSFEAAAHEGSRELFVRVGDHCSDLLISDGSITRRFATQFFGGGRSRIIELKLDKDETLDGAQPHHNPALC